MSSEPTTGAPSLSEQVFPQPVRIIGTGLIGGSIGLALGSAGIDVSVQDVSPGTEALAIEMGVGRRPLPGEADPALVLVAAPPDVSAHIVATALWDWPRAIVADLASVKTTVLSGIRAEVARGTLREEDMSRYIGAHPMAGRESSGVISARGDLFQGRPFVVVPHATTRNAARTTLRTLAMEIGSVPFEMDAAAHDDAVALVSHVPQVLSSLLATSLIEGDDSSLALAGQGLRDTSRIAASDPRIWVEILGANAAAISPVLEQAHSRLGEVIAALGTLAGDPDPALGSRRAIASLIADGNRGAARIPGKHGGARESFTRATVLVPDRPGHLARLLTEIGDIGVNLEDLHLEHTYGKKVGLAHVSIERSCEALLTRELRERGWTVVDG